VAPKISYDLWWKYAIEAIIEAKRKTRLDLILSSKRIVLMKKYIHLYKRKQNIVEV
jgi:hypothetical protein